MVRILFLFPYLVLVVCHNEAKHKEKREKKGPGKNPVANTIRESGMEREESYFLISMEGFTSAYTTLPPVCRAFSSEVAPNSNCLQGCVAEPCFLAFPALLFLCAALKMVQK